MAGKAVEPCGHERIAFDDLLDRPQEGVHCAGASGQAVGRGQTVTDVVTQAHQEPRDPRGPPVGVHHVGVGAFASRVLGEEVGVGKLRGGALVGAVQGEVVEVDNPLAVRTGDGRQGGHSCRIALQGLAGSAPSRCLRRPAHAS